MSYNCRTWPKRAPPRHGSPHQPLLVPGDLMKKNNRVYLIPAALASALVLSACVATQPIPQPAPAPTPAPKPKVDRNALRVLAQMEEMEREIQRLQAMLEEQENTISQMRERNVDVVNDMDQRLRDQESAISDTNARLQTELAAATAAAEAAAAEAEARAAVAAAQQTQPAVVAQPVLVQPVNPGAQPAITAGAVTPTTSGTLVGQGGSVATQPAIGETQSGTLVGAGGSAIGTVDQPTQPITSAATSVPTTGSDTVVIGSTTGIGGVQAVTPTPVTTGDVTATGAGTAAADQTQLAVATPAELIPASPAATDAYNTAFELLKQGRYNEAVTDFEGFLGKHGNTDLADDATFWVAEAKRVSREWEGALASYEAVMSNFPTSQKVPDAMLKVGIVQYEIGAYANARATLGEVVSRYPGSRVASSAQQRLARMDSEGR